MKKIIALVLALVMILSLSTVAFADKKTSPIKETVANVAAVLLQKPAFYLANTLSFYADNADVTLSENNLPNAYKALEANLFAIDYAVQTGALLAKANLKINAALTDAVGLASLTDLAQKTYKTVDGVAKAVKNVVAGLKTETIGDLFGNALSKVLENAPVNDPELEWKLQWNYELVKEYTLETAMKNHPLDVKGFVQNAMYYVADIISNPEYFAPMGEYPAVGDVGGKSAVAEFIYWKLLNSKN